MKKDNKDHSNLLLTLSAFMLIISICTFIYIYNDIFPDINKLPVSIWGTVSDWVMVGITVTTAVFLYRTLNSQMIVQKDQEKINKLNMVDIRSKYLPMILNNQHQLENTYYSIDCLRQPHFLVENHNAILLTIKSELLFTQYFEGNIFKEENKFCQKISMIIKGTKFPIRFDESIVQEFLNSDIIKKNHGIDFIPYNKITFEYEDNFGFKYLNSFTYEYQPFTKLVNIRESNIDYL